MLQCNSDSIKSIFFDDISNLNSCLTCKCYKDCVRECLQLTDSHDTCTSFKHFKSKETLEPKMKSVPRPIKLVHIEKISNYVVYIHCATDGAYEFIENHAYEYGWIRILRKKVSKINNIPIFRLDISNVYNIDQVCDYLSSYSEE